MTDERPDLEGAIRRLDAGDATDAAVAIVSAISSAIPVVGGALAAGLGEWRLHMATNRLVLVLDEFRKAIDRVRDQVDRPFAASTEFRRAVDWTIESGTQARNGEKRRAYAAALAKTATFGRPEESERSLMLDTLDRLQPAHLLLLAALAHDPDPPRGPAAYLDPETEANARLREALPSVPIGLLDRLWEDLAAMRLIDSASLLSADGGTVTAHLPDSVLMPFGLRFLKFVSLDE